MCKMVWYKLLLVLCFTFFPESCVPPPSSGTQQLPTAPLTIIATANPNKYEFVGEVIGIKDGDTVEVLHNNQSTVVSFYRKYSQLFRKCSCCKKIRFLCMELGSNNLENRSSSFLAHWSLHHLQSPLLQG